VNPELVFAAVRASWTRESCDPVDLHLWSESCPERGQCGVTAVLVQELLGGDLLLADVLFADGSPQGVHYWNRLPGGEEVDLTRSQFQDGELVGMPRVVGRPATFAGARLEHQHRVLRTAVGALLSN
jgi:hypothetical protein